MAKGLCPKCGDPIYKSYSYCRQCYNAWQNARNKLKPKPQRTPEQREAQNQRDRERIARMTPEEKQAYDNRKRQSQALWLAANPEIRARRNKEANETRKTWSPERRERQKNTQKSHYEKCRNRPNQGLCGYSVNCNEPPIGEQKFCLYHWCNGLRQDDVRLKSNYMTEALVALWNAQDGRCAISGIKLIPGNTSHLDHITPVAKGGTSDIGNLRFIHKYINGFKWDQSDDQLKALILEIDDKMIQWAKK